MAKGRIRFFLRQGLLSRKINSSNIFFNRSFFAFRTPQGKDIKIREILRPLAENVWNRMSLILFLISILFCFVLRYESYNSFFGHYCDSVIIIIGSISQQSK